jgi:hypothetical protein
MQRAPGWLQRKLDRYDTAPDPARQARITSVVRKPRGGSGTTIDCFP